MSKDEKYIMPDGTKFGDEAVDALARGLADADNEAWKLKQLVKVMKSALEHIRDKSIHLGTARITAQRALDTVKENGF